MLRYRQLSGTDWLRRAHVLGPDYARQLSLQRPAEPQWGLAIRDFLASQSIACEKKEYDGECPIATWTYAERPEETDTEQDPCLRRKVLLWALQHVPPAELGPALPALLSLLGSGAMELNADLATAVLQRVPLGDPELAWPIVKALLPQQQPDLGLRLPELDRHLRGLSDERLQQLVAAGHVYEALLRALLARPLSPATHTALLQALGRDAHAHRMLRLAILDKLATVPAEKLRVVAETDRDCYVRGRAAALLAGRDALILRPADAPPRSDAETLEQVCHAFADGNETRRAVRLRAMILPGATLVHRTVDPDEDGNPNSPITRTKRSPLTLPALLAALKYEMDPGIRYKAGAHHVDLSTAGGLVGDNSYKIVPGQRRGRHGVARVDFYEDHVIGSCY